MTKKYSTEPFPIPVSATWDHPTAREYNSLFLKSIPKTSITAHRSFPPKKEKKFQGANVASKPPQRCIIIRYMTDLVL